MIPFRHRRARRLCIAVLVSVAPMLASSPLAAQQAEPSTRTEQIEQARRDKQATLWPERENPMVARANGLLDRGLAEGIRSGQGKNGWQVLLTGTRPAQGQSFGIGYRRTDLFRDALTAHAGVTGTLAGALMVDGQLQLNRLKQSKDTFIDVCAKYERSPHMEFYGLAAGLAEGGSTSTF